MHPAIAQHRSGIAAICQRYGIQRLEVFGSAARNPARDKAANAAWAGSNAGVMGSDTALMG